MTNCAFGIRAKSEESLPAARLRVALCYSDCHSRGGVERVLSEAASYLSRSCEVTVIARSFSDRGDPGDNVKRECLGGRRLPFGLDLPSVRRRTENMVRTKQWDVWAGFGVQAPEGSVVWVQSVHAAWWEETRLRRTGWRRFVQGVNPFHKVVLRMEEVLFRRRRYRRLIALTPRVRDDLERFYGVDPSLVDVLPNGFSRGDFNVGLRRTYGRLLRAKLGILEDAWVVLFVANEWERKGFLPLLEAVARLKDRTVHVVAVGNLPKAFLLKEAEKRGMSGRVHVVGASDGVQRWFGIADAFALPTVYEAWGMVIVEAMAAGLPVLTSRCAGAAVAVKEAFSGLLLDDPTDVLEIACGLEKLRAGVFWTCAEIAASVSEYEWPAILVRYEKILRASV